MATAALHRSMRDVVAPHPVAVAWLSPTRLWLLALAMLTGPALVLMVNVRWESDVPMLAIGSALLSLLVLWRLVSVVRALARDNAARVKLEGELSYRAAHDPLTGLPNRRRFLERLDRALARVNRPPLAVLFLDLDGFKTVNDSLGSRRGRCTAGRGGRAAAAAPARRHIVARLGGDEFGILLDGGRTPRGQRVAERILAALDEPLVLDGPAASPSARASASADRGRRDHDGASCCATPTSRCTGRRRGKGRARRYDDMARRSRATGWSSRATCAGRSTTDELARHYQPIVELATRRASSASRRWCAGSTRARAAARPPTFIPLAEETGLIMPLGGWVLREACRAAARWQREHRPDARRCRSTSRRASSPAGLRGFDDRRRSRTAAAEG